MTFQRCDYCRGPICRSGLKGRPHPGRLAMSYCCYGCLSIGEHESACETGCESSREALPIVRLGVSLLLVGQSMAFGLAVNLTPPDATVLAALHGAIFCSTLVVIALLGGPLFRAGWQELRSGRVTIELLFLLTMGGAMAASLQSFLAGEGPIYFEVVSILLVVYTLGRMVGARGRSAALASSARWSDSLSTCHTEAGDVPVSSIRAGDVVEVNPGEAIPVDGVIRDGAGFVTESAVTGEPFPAAKRPGDVVRAGSASVDAFFRVTASAAGTERKIDRLLEAVREARHRPMSIQRQADRLSRAFAPVVACVALMTFAYWSWSAGWREGLFNAMSVLLVACPCVLGLATPVVTWSVLGRLARAGLIVRSGDAVERLARVDRVIFDKTGTLTDDRFVLADIATFAEGTRRARILGWLSLVQSRSSHPMARPFAELPRAADAELLSLRALPGIGVEAELSADGAVHTVRIGRPCRESTELLGRLLTTEGHRVGCEIDGELAAVAVVRERARDTAPGALAELGRLGLPVEILTGSSSVNPGLFPGTELRAQQTPESKRDRVAGLIASGQRPLMIGDGVNDASALATAHVGIALAEGTDLANDAADVTLYGADLRAIPWAIGLSREAVGAVRRNLLRAAGYNVIGVSVAACGLLHPVFAALLMVASSLTLLWSATRVGSAPCRLPVTPRPAERPGARARGARLPAMAHGTALGAQGVFASLLLGLSLPLAVAVTLATGVIGVIAGRAWLRRPTIPHRLDMAFGMLTLGNLGMLAGCWADAGFSRLPAAACPHCTGGNGLWMWAGMFALGNLAMLTMMRRPCPMNPVSMYAAGNVGMALGMVGGSSAAAGAGPLAALTGMTIGMTLGMMLASELCEFGLACGSFLRSNLGTIMRRRGGRFFSRSTGLGSGGF